MLFDPKTGEIFGAQGVGMSGVEKRIDVIATAIKGGLTAYDLPDVETCYAPPYNSAKDPVNMLGYVASNILDGDVENVQWYEIEGLRKNGELIVDVRDEVELGIGSIEGSENIPLCQLRDRLEELPNDKKIYVTCQVGLRGYIACRILSQNGYICANIDGGMKTYLMVKNTEEKLKNKDLIQSKKDDIDSISDEEIAVTSTLDTRGLTCPE